MIGEGDGAVHSVIVMPPACVGPDVVRQDDLVVSAMAPTEVAG